MKVDGEKFKIKVRDLNVNSNYNVSVNVYDEANDLICGWHDKHTKSSSEIKKDVLSYLSSNDDLLIL